MKLLILFLVVAMSAAGQPFYSKTKHKPIKRMTRREVMESAKGRTLYERKGNVVTRNTFAPWSTVKKPQTYRPYWHDISDSKARMKKRKETQLFFRDDKLTNTDITRYRRVQRKDRN
jgi:hypothetical protein